MALGTLAFYSVSTEEGGGIILLDVVSLHACEGWYTFHLMTQLTATIIYGIGVEWIWVRSIRRMILKRGNQTEIPGENVSHYHSAHHKPHVNWPGTESETMRWKVNDQQPGPW